MTFGDRLHEIRMRKGMTQEEVAKQVSLKKMSISKYESGKMLPSSSILIALCNLFDVGADYFFREDAVRISATPQFRLGNNAKITKADRERIRLQTERAVGCLKEISDICKYDTVTNSSHSLRRSVRNIDDIEILAEDVRSAWCLGLDPIENLMDVSESHGFTIILADGPATFDAAVFIDEVYGPIITLRRDAARDRQRFTLAHELGHYFILSGADNVRFQNEEAQANRFAAALLIPKPLLIEDVGWCRNTLSADELCMLHDKYGVSINALLIRMASLGIISAELMNKWVAYDRAGRVDKKSGRYCNGYDGREEPRLARKLVFRAVAEGYISERKGAELLEEGFFGSFSSGVDA